MKEGLIFDWPGRHHLHLLLPVAIVAAIAVHAGLFFLFSIIYPRPESPTIDAAKVFFVPPGSIEWPRLSALLQSEDPAIFAPGRGLPLSGAPPAVEYTPQYDTVKPVLDDLPAVTSGPEIVLPSAKPVPVLAGNAPQREIPPATPFVRLTATGPLAGRVPNLPPDSGLYPEAGLTPGKAVFLSAVRPDGSVAHVFSQQSSGNDGIDRKAAAALRRLRFSGGSGDMEWGFVTFEWSAAAPAVR
jgi:hypothetical protein